MTDQPDAQPVQYGPTRAVLTLFDYNPPVVVMIDVNNNAVATTGIPEHLFESIRVGVATAIGPIATPAEEPQKPTPGLPRGGTDPHREQSQTRGKGKGKNKGKKGKPEWAGDPEHPDHPRNKVKKDKPESPDSPESADTPDEPADEIPVEPLPDVIDPENLEPVEGDVDVRDPQYEPIKVNATAEIVPALFEQWAAEKYSEVYGPDNDIEFPDPALHPELVREYLNDLEN